MIVVAPDSPFGVMESVGTMAAKVVADGAPEPAFLVVPDPAGRWLVETAARAERSRAAVVAVDDETLVEAIRLDLGGAFGLPPSTIRTTAAFEAANRPPRLALAAPEPALVELVLGRASEVVSATFANRDAWLRELGLGALSGLLAALASRLDRLPAVLEAPALVVDRLEAGEVEAGWRALAAELGGALPEVVAWRHRVEPADRLAALRSTIAERAAEAPRGPRWWPVRELPGGRALGWWGLGGGGERPDSGWVATPARPDGVGHRWALSGSGVEPLAAIDRARVDELNLAPGSVVRVPGWATRRLGRGSPSGLLVERLVEAAAEAGANLWVSHVDQPALDLLLLLRRPLWVDGPAVPH